MPDLLIATNGFKGTWASIEYGAWLAGLLKARITLLGVDEKPGTAPSDSEPALDAILAQAVELFKRNRLEYELITRKGNAEEVIPQQANVDDLITVVGPLGRPQLRRWLMGRSIRNLMEAIKGPILYVPSLRLPMRKTLMCVGGLGYEVAAENLGFQVAMKNNSEVTLLHVVPPINLDYPASRAERENWDHLLDTNTLPGRSLRQALETAQSMGVKASVITRQGKVEEEILDEIRHGDYDLVCLGSSYSASVMRQLSAPNVTADIAETVACPMLTARHKLQDN